MSVAAPAPKLKAKLARAHAEDDIAKRCLTEAHGKSQNNLHFAVSTRKCSHRLGLNCKFGRVCGALINHFSCCCQSVAKPSQDPAPAPEEKTQSFEALEQWSLRQHGALPSEQATQYKWTGPNLQACVLRALDKFRLNPLQRVAR